MVERTDNNSRQVHPAETSPKQSAKTCRVRRFFLGATLFAIIALLWAHFIPLQYTGTAMFTRRKGPVTTGASFRGSESFESLKVSLQYDLASREAVEEAIKNLDLTKNMERNPEDGGFTSRGQSAKQQLVRDFSQKIKINWEVDSAQIDLVSVSFTHSDQYLAKEMPNTLVLNYIDRVLNQTVAKLKNDKEFLERQVQTGNYLLNGLIRERIEFEEKNKGAIPESSSVLYEKILQTSADLDAVRFQHKVAILELDILESLEKSRTGSTSDPNELREIVMLPNPEMARPEEELRQSKKLLDAILYAKIMKEDYPIVQLLQRKIGRLEELIQQTEPMVETNQVYSKTADDPVLAIQLLGVKATVEGTQGEIKRLESRLKAYEDILSNFGYIRQKYLELTKKIEYKQAEMSRWEERLLSVDMALAAAMADHGTQLDAVQVAQKQFRPQSPSLTKIFLITLCGALVVGGISMVLPLRFRLPGRIIMLVFIVFFILVVGFLATSITLRINYPEEYQVWRTDEVQYLKDWLSAQLEYSKYWLSTL